MKILVINPGSTSTKWAVYDGCDRIWNHTTHHSPEELRLHPRVFDQLDMRTQATVNALEEAGIPMRFDAVIARGGLLKPTPSGVYRIDGTVLHDLEHASLEHACNLGAIIADRIAGKCDCPAFIADPEVVDEMMPEARPTGIAGIERKSVFHALNTKAVARRYAESVNRPYEDLNLILVHLGGGISVGAHHKGRVIDVNNALNGDGPFSPERAGTVPADDLVELCFSGTLTKTQIKQLLNGRGGLSSLLCSNNVADISARAEKGEEPYKSVLDAMLYSVAREIGARAVALRGNVDAIILTGGIAHSDYCVRGISKWVDWIGPIVVRAGEDELDSLAFNAFGAMTGHLPIQTYSPGA